MVAESDLPQTAPSRRRSSQACRAGAVRSSRHSSPWRVRRSVHARRDPRRSSRRGCPASRPLSARRSTAPSSRCGAGRGRRRAARASGPEELLGGPREGELALRPLAATENRRGDDLRLVDRRHGLGLLTLLLAATVELRRVDPTRKDQADVDAGSVLLLLRARRLEVRPARCLRRAIGRLQRDPSIGQARVDVDEGSARGLQVRQCCAVGKRSAEEVDVITLRSSSASSCSTSA